MVTFLKRFFENALGEGKAYPRKKQHFIPYHLANIKDFDNYVRETSCKLAAALGQLGIINKLKS
jgi:hypothetical protein